jgi:tryptophanyl-tRNA synthetase
MERLKSSSEQMRILTGIKPTGDIHLGNYIGAIRPIIQMDGDKLCLIADYHSMTSTGRALEEDTFKMAATLMALDETGELVIYRQSAFPELHELTWYISCNTSTGILDRGHAVKAAEAGGNVVSNGTLLYPLLMTADILSVQSEGVTVGKDQLQHLRIARDIAKSFNHHYGEMFTLPDPILMSTEPILDIDMTPIPRHDVVLGLDGKKMSKSYGNTIPLMLSKKKLKKLIMSIETDSTPMEDPKDPDSCTVFSLYQHFASDDKVRIMRSLYRGGNFGYGHAKLQLVEEIEKEIGPARERYNALIANPTKVYERIEQGCQVVEPLIRETINKVRAAVHS